MHPDIDNRDVHDGDVDNGAGTLFLFGHVIVGHLVVAWLGGVGGLDGIVGFFDGIIVATGSGGERNRKEQREEA